MAFVFRFFRKKFLSDDVRELLFMIFFVLCLIGFFTLVICIYSIWRFL
nr:MAG TPA: hypothetical protein [Microviridae sp.]